MPWFHQVRFVPVDLTDARDEVFERLERPDAVVHLAWEGLPDYLDMSHLEEHLFCQYRFLRSLIGGGLSHLLVAGTCQEYGLQDGCLSESSPVCPTTPYALAKDFLRQMLVQLSRIRPFVLQWLRIFYLHGDGQHPRSLLGQLAGALERGDAEFPMSGGEQLRDFLPVEEAARRIVKISEQTSVEGVINCCSGTPISVRRFVEEYLRRRGRSIQLCLGSLPYPDFEPMAFWGDTDKWRSTEGAHGLD